ncbi:MAG: hypothetical protein KAT76_05995 [Bacteroidales bacterium]|nr:hypothetical protein [Bacteroidales bacterium]
MRYLLIIILAFSLSGVSAQITKMVQVKDQTFQMNGVQYGQPVEKKTKTFGLTVNYETGELKGVINLIDIDLLNKNIEASPDPEMNALKIRGFLPMNDILYNMNEQQHYKVEIDLVIKELTVVALFEFNIAYVKNTQLKFHNVIANAPVNLLDFNIEDLNGFESQVNVIMMFQMLNLQR